MPRWCHALGRLGVLLYTFSLAVTASPAPTVQVVEGYFVLMRADGPALPPSALVLPGMWMYETDI